ncbi:MAG: Uma2 family endonuclease [Candidatus Cloacimonetes bacterium]|nr:Uma2 family endonuclease [Candidatus Cloacimonadota bacterium]
MSSPLLQKDTQYTWEDYASWDTDVSYELINGAAYALSSPRQIHQRLLLKLAISFENFLSGKSCYLFIAPSDVKLDEKTIVQPDLFVVCDKSKLDGQFTNGPPDLVIEIESQNTTQRDRILKYNKYLETGVPEYWIIDPVGKVIEVFVVENMENAFSGLTEKRYIRSAFSDKDKVPVSVLEGCVIDMFEVFEDLELSNEI